MSEGERTSLSMPLSKAGIDAWVRAVRERDNKYGQAAQSPMIQRDLSRAQAPRYTPSVQGVPTAA